MTPYGDIVLGQQGRRDWHLACQHETNIQTIVDPMAFCDNQLKLISDEMLKIIEYTIYRGDYMYLKWNKQVNNQMLFALCYKCCR